MVGKNLSHYKILVELGRGGKGIVYKAEDTELNRIVVLKFLTTDVNSSKFEQESTVNHGSLAKEFDASR